jgi:NTP pyrophosphatase (non-canonical NTP hydrolase)
MERIKKINEGLRKRFPDGENPFQMVTRLAEECGELAAQVNHFEGSGIKQQKHGQPDRHKLAKEVQDVLRCALRIATYYGVEAELEAALNISYQRMKTEGWLN